MAKTHRLLVAGTLALSSVFVPLAMSSAAYADDNFTYTATFTATGTHTLAVAGGNGIQVDGSDVITLSAPAANPSDPPVTVGTANCADTTHCTITVTDGPTAELIYNNSGISVKTDDDCMQDADPGYRINHNSSYTIGDPSGSLFTGKIWFFWNCNGGFCKQLITGITGTEDNEDPFTGQHTFTYHTKYVNQNTLDDGGKTPNVAALNSSDDNYRIIWEVPGNTPANDATIDTWAKYIAWENSQLTPGTVKTCTNGEGQSYQYDPTYDALKRLRIDPTGASKGKNIISTNGDRAFRLTIYDPANYYGVTNAAQPDDLTYWPDFWDQGMFNPAYDVSGTTADAPQTMQAYLLSDTVTLSADAVSAPIEGIETANEADARVVNITHTGGTWNIQFKSNYYDKVVFKITAGGKSYYLQINRLNILATLPDDHDPAGIRPAGARVYTPATDTGNYDVVATYYLANGSTKTVTLEKSGNKQNAGKNLVAQFYKVPESAGINFAYGSMPRGVSLTVVRAGSTPTNYQGTLAGSGRGVYYTFDQGGAIFGKKF